MRSTISFRYVIFLLPLLLLFLLFSILTADPGTEKLEFKELPEPAELSALTILSPTQDTILYDNNTAALLDTTLDAWTGVRFTPLYNFELQAVYFAILNQYNNTTDGCSLYVVADDGAGEPDWPSGILDAFWVPPPLPDMIWMQVDLSSPISFSAYEDFHVIYGPAPGGAYPGTGWWNLLDSDGTTTQRSHVSHDDRQTWLTIGDADSFIGAGGEYFTVMINEIRHTPIGGRASFGKAWVEIYSAGEEDQDLTGWKISNNDLTTLVDLPSWTLPAKKFLTVYFGSGTNDSDFVDDEGVYYTGGDSTGILDGDNDGCALYTGPPSTSTILDFLSWSTDGAYTEGVAHQYAEDRGIWGDGAYVDASAFGLRSSMGLCPSGFDHDLPGDWREYDWGTYFLSIPHEPENAIQITPFNGSVLSGSILLDWADVFVSSGTVEYVLQVDDDSTFGSPIVQDTLSSSQYNLNGGLAENLYYWRVLILWDNVLVNSVNAVWDFIFISVGPKNPQQPVHLDIDHQWQHKDTHLLCLWDMDGWENSTQSRPGCTEGAAPNPTGPWDDEHPWNHAPTCRHCHWYCQRASIAMINSLFRGDTGARGLHQDRISYFIFNGYIPDGNIFQPEGDLGHNVGTLVGERTAALEWALNDADVRHHAGSPTYAQVRTEIDAERPVMITIRNSAGGTHTEVIDGYETYIADNGQTIEAIHLHDPWPVRGPIWLRYTVERGRIRHWWTLPHTPITGIVEEWGVVQDVPDGDGVYNLDEDFRFHTDVTKSDTEGDEVNDKQEIRSYTFHDRDASCPHPANINDGLNFPDIDGDDKRAELDCDTDNDSDFDGGEDINGNGICGDGPNETDVYHHPGMKGFVMDPDFEIWIDTDKYLYYPGEHVILYGQTFHADTLYHYDIIPDCPDLPDSSGLEWDGSVTTDGGGVINPPKDLGAFPVGVYEVVVDVLSDSHYNEPDNWDPWTCFAVIDPVYWRYHSRFVDGWLTVYGTVNCSPVTPPLFGREHIDWCDWYYGLIPTWCNDLLVTFEWDLPYGVLTWMKVVPPLDYFGPYWVLPRSFPGWIREYLPPGSQVRLPSIGDSTGAIPNVYVTVNLGEWVADPRPPQDQYTIVDGACDDLPGYLIGTSPITFDSLAPPGDWRNAFPTTPLTGTLHRDGDLVIGTDSEVGCCQFPASCAMLPEAACTTAGGTWHASPPYHCVGSSCVPGSNFSMTPEFLDEDILEGEIVDEHLYLSNPGGEGDLIFSMTDPADWLSEHPDAGSVMPDMEEDVIVRVDGTDMIAGYYYTEITITTNDFDHPEVICPVYVHVGPDPDIDVAPSFPASVIPGCQYSVPMLISNLGGGTLAFNVAVADAPPMFTTGRTGVHDALEALRQAGSSNPDMTPEGAYRTAGAEKSTVQYSGGTSEGLLLLANAGKTADILLVDDDGGLPGGTYSDIEDRYTDALDANGYVYDYYVVDWIDPLSNGPDLTTMQAYSVVIWFTGETWGYYGADVLTANDEANLAAYLDGGGNLFLSAQDYLWASYPSAGSFSPGQFPYDYLHLASVSQDAINDPYSVVGGMGSVAEGMAFDCLRCYDLNPDVPLWTDYLFGQTKAVNVFEESGTATAVQYDAGDFKTLFTTTEFAGLVDGSPSTRAEFMAAVVEWMLGGGCPFTVTPESGLVDPESYGFLTLTFDGDAFEECVDETLACYLVITSNDPDEPQVTVEVSMWPGRGDVFDPFCRIDLGDLVFLINYVLKGGPAPDPLCMGDCDPTHDGVVDLADVVYLVQFLYQGGMPPLAIPEVRQPSTIKQLSPQTPAPTPRKLR